MAEVVAAWRSSGKERKVSGMRGQHFVDDLYLFETCTQIPSVVLTLLAFRREHFLSAKKPLSNEFNNDGQNIYLIGRQVVSPAGP